MTHPLPRSIYLHIPFCVRKCLYCDFTSYSDMEPAFAVYADALRAEIVREARRHPDARISTIYFGGGTPTILHPQMLSGILDEIRSVFAVDADAEITTEANPGIQGIFPLLRQAGFNRLSLGVQSLHDDELRLLGRIHSADEAVHAFRGARDAGFGSISIDLMYGIPGQTRESWQDTLRQAARLKLEHISLYSLTVEEGTPFFWMQEHDDLELPGDDAETDMYEDAIRMLTDAGFRHYEISSFAMPGFRCRHNITYWKNEPYFGFGVGAASYVDGVRASSAVSVEEYIGRIQRNEPAANASERLGGRESMGETVFLGLRMMDGIDVAAFERRYDVSLRKAFGAQIDALTAQGMLVREGRFIRLTHKGLLFSNDVFAEFV